jgi:hypothetical protein
MLGLRRYGAVAGKEYGELRLILIADSCSQPQKPSLKSKVKGGGQECPPHTPASVSAATQQV